LRSFRVLWTEINEATPIAFPLLKVDSSRIDWCNQEGKFVFLNFLLYHCTEKVDRDKLFGLYGSVDDNVFSFCSSPVTEKVTVYESCSESESETASGAKKTKEEESVAKSGKTTESAPKVEKPTTSKDTKKPAKKTVSPVKNKQSSLMNFFKKV